MTATLTNNLAKNIIKIKKWRTTHLKLLGAGVNGRVYNIEYVPSIGKLITSRRCHLN